MSVLDYVVSLVSLIFEILRYSIEQIRSARRYLHDHTGYRSIFLVGGLLWGYGIWLVVPSIVVMGFFILILNDAQRYGKGESDSIEKRWGTSSKEQDKERENPNWIGFFTDGLKSYIIWMSFFLVAVIGSTPFINESESGAFLLSVLNVLNGGGMVSILLSLSNAAGFQPPDVSVAKLSISKGLLFLLVMYLAPAALISYSESRRLKDGFDSDRIRERITKPAYALNWVLFMGFWILSVLILQSYSNVLAYTLIPIELGGSPSILREFLIEAIEISRGFVSFYLFSLAIAVMGFSQTENSNDQVQEIGRLHFSSTSLLEFVKNTDDFIKTMLIGGLLVTFGSLPSTIILTGYITKTLKAFSSEDSDSHGIPTFGRVGTLLRDGVYITTIWICYLLVPLVLLMSFDIPYRAPRSQEIIPLPLVNEVITFAEVITHATFTFGAIVGTPAIGRDIYLFLYSDLIGGNELAEINLVFRPLFQSLLPYVWYILALFLLIAFLAIYLAPISFYLATVENDESHSSYLVRFTRIAREPLYFTHWLRAFGYWFAIAMLIGLWNWWRFRLPSQEIRSIVAFEPLPSSLFAFPTDVGIKSSAALFILSTVGFYLLTKSYIVLGTGIRKIVHSPSGTRKDPE